jgi:hypothetical protein
MPPAPPDPMLVPDPLPVVALLPTVVMSFEVAAPELDAPPTDVAPVVSVRPAPETLLAAGDDPRGLVLAWYDPETSTWLILPTAVTDDGMLEAQSDRTGTFALLLPPPEAILSDV